MAPVRMLIGRERELSALKEAQNQHRLVTIWGPGGVGKSSIARELATLHRASGAEVFSIGLRDVVPSLDGLVAALSRELELETPNPALSTVARALEARERPLLLVDEGESALGPLGRLLAELLSRTAHVRFLLTSRSLLGLAEEHPYELAPLATRRESAEAQPPAAQLFLARARTFVPHFQMSDGALDVVLSSTEGIPLAIELMAADCATLSEDAALVRMPSSLDTTIERSWNRLAPDERESLISLSTFSGAFSAAAASAVLGPLRAPHLSSLRRQSLVLADTSYAETPLFRVLTAVRTFARTRVDQTAWQSAMHAHATYFANVARTTSTERGLVEELLAIAQRAVLEESLLPYAADAFDALLDRLTVDVGTVRTLLDEVLRVHAESTWVPRLLAARALASEASGDLPAAAAFLTEAERIAAERCTSLDPYVSLARSTVSHGLSDIGLARTSIAALLTEETPARIRGRAFALLSAVEHVEGHLPEALAAVEAALLNSREAGDERAVHRSTLRLAFGLLDSGQPERALAELSIFTTPNAPRWQRALASTYRGNTLRRLGDLDGARTAHAAAIALFRQASSRRWEATALMDAGITELAGYAYGDAIAPLERALTLSEEVTDAHLQELIAGYLAIASLFAGNLERARLLVARAARDAATATAARSTEIHVAHVHYADGTGSRAALEEAMNPNGKKAPSPTEHIRWATTFARRSIEQREPPRDALVILDPHRVHLPALGDAEETWVDLSRKPTLDRLLTALAKAHTPRGGTQRPLTVTELLQVGWPEERLQRAAAENRLRVALSSLRALGNGSLKTLILHDKDGYRLAEDLRVITHV